MRIPFQQMENLREQMVDNVELNNAVEKVLADKAKLPVNSGESALNIGPVFSLIMRDLLVGVVEVGDSN